MTAKDIDHTDDAEFEDFLLGKGELADLLRTLPQAAPSAELDAKILRDAEAALAATTVPLGTTAIRAAANDPAPHAIKPPIGFFSRWRMPLGLVATLLLSMSVTFKVWRGQDVRSTPPVLVADETAPAAEPAAPVRLAQAPASHDEKGKLDAMQASPVDKAAPPALAKERSFADAKAGPAPELARIQKKAKREAMADSPAVAAMPKAENRAAAPVMAEQAESRAAPAPAAAPAQVASGSVQENRTQESLAVASRRTGTTYSGGASDASQVQVSGTVRARNEVRQDVASADQPIVQSPQPPVKPVAPAVAAAAPPPAKPAAAKVASSSESAAPWLLRIEKWLKEGKPKEALEEWQKFRLAYPDYAVPPATLKQIEALQPAK